MVVLEGGRVFGGLLVGVAFALRKKERKKDRQKESGKNLSKTLEKGATLVSCPTKLPKLLAREGGEGTIERGQLLRIAERGGSEKKVWGKPMGKRWAVQLEGGGKKGRSTLHGRSVDR